MKKILIDTNLILRYVLDGDSFLPELAKSNLIWITNEVMIEVAYTLLSFYKVNRVQVFDLLTKLLMRPNIECKRVLLFNSLATFRDNPNLSLIDSFLINLSEVERVELATYDKKLARRAVRN